MLAIVSTLEIADLFTQKKYVKNIQKANAMEAMEDLKIRLRFMQICMKRKKLCCEALCK